LEPCAQFLSIPSLISETYPSFHLTINAALGSYDPNVGAIFGVHTSTKFDISPIKARRGWSRDARFFTNNDDDTMGVELVLLIDPG
jgi:hypothetical protein